MHKFTIWAENYQMPNETDAEAAGRYLKEFPMHKYTVWLDGGSKGNGTPEAKGYGSYLVKEGKAEKHISYEFETKGMTNNEAEWAILLCLLNDIRRGIPFKQQHMVFICHMDSKLVVNMFEEEWAGKDERMKTLRDIALDGRNALANNGIEIHMIYCPRSEIVDVLGH